MFVHQSIHRPHGINVFGSSLLRAEPDYASIRFTIANLAAEPKDALAATQGGVNSVHVVLLAHGVAPRDVRTSRVSIKLAHEGYGDARRAIGYRADSELHAFARDLARVQDLLIAIVGAGGREIESVSYQTSRLRELRREARKSAVASARAKAEVYAEAAGVAVGKPLHIEDVNPESLAQRGHTPDIDLASHDEADPSGTNTGSIAISAAVMVCFALVG